MNRRDFLVFPTSIIAAVTLGGLSSQRAGNAQEVKFPERTCEGITKKRVLVVYARKYGSTQGVANGIADELCGRGMAADVAAIENTTNIVLRHIVAQNEVDEIGQHNHIDNRNSAMDHWVNN